MSIFSILKQLFSEPKFHQGARVNYVPGGHIALTDGYVLGQDSAGVHVEFFRKGKMIIPARDLCAICV